MTQIADYQPAANCLADRIILITGAGGNIGSAVAKAAAQHGATVILLGKTLSKLEKVYDDIKQAGHPEAIIMPMDLLGATADDYQTMAEAIEKEFGKLDGLLHNAAMLGSRMTFEQYDLELWHKVIQVNLTAPLMLTQSCLPLLKKSDDASIIFTSSLVGRKGLAYWGGYAITKAGNENMMQILADELEDNTSIRVNSIDPGPVRSPMRLAAFPGEDQSTVPRAEDKVNGYLYLLGGDSTGVTGEQFTL